MAFPSLIKRSALTLLAGSTVLLTACDKKSPTSSATAAETAGGVVLATKNHVPPTGTVITENGTLTITNGTMKIKAGAREMDGTMNTTESSQKVAEVLSPTRIRRTFVTETKTTEMVINGQNQKEPSHANPLLGKPVITDFADGKWTARLENGTPDAEQTKEIVKLTAQANQESDYLTYGDTPRKPGDKWEVAPNQIAETMGGKNAKGSCMVELVGLEEFEGTKCALVKSTLNVDAEQDVDTPTPMKMHILATATVRRSIADKVDLAVDIDGTISVEGSPSEQVSFKIAGPIQMKQRNALKRP